MFSNMSKLFGVKVVFNPLLSCIDEVKAFLSSFETYAGGDIVILSPRKGDSAFLGYLANSPELVRRPKRNEP